MIEYTQLSAEDPNGLGAGMITTSLEKLYQLLQEAHAERELREYEVTCRKADLEAARKELEKAQHFVEAVRKRSADIELAIVDRRRAERGIAIASPPVPVHPETGAPE